MKKLISLLFFTLCLLVAIAQRPGDIVILYENDVHCAIDGYPVIAGLRDSLQRMGCHVAVVSAGDFSSGGSIGAASKGEFVIRMMNAVGYDAVCLGNHEFDFGFDQLLTMEDMLSAPMLCCNLVSNTQAGNQVPFTAFVLRNLGGMTVAFVGVTTPTTMYTSNPASFKDEAGNYIYNFSPATLAATVQRSVDAARAAGAQFVVLLSHLGDSDGVPTSVRVVSQLTGVDAVLDGHDHHIIPCRMIPDQKGRLVPLTSTGTLFQKLGMMTISSHPDAKQPIAFKLFSTDSLGRKGCISQSVADTVRVIKETFDAMGGRVVATTNVQLIAEEGDIRVCRLRETNLGDLISDAYRTLMGTDIGWINSGSIRANIPVGPITHNQLFAVTPYNNTICVIRTTGKDILDALETAVREYPKAEGCFAQVSGLSFTFDPSVPSSVVLDSNGTFLRVDGPYRVSNVQVGGKPLDLQQYYTIASSDYVLLKGGDAIRFPNAKQLPTDPVSDLQVFENYLLNNLHGIIDSTYEHPQGRIVNTMVRNKPKIKQVNSIKSSIILPKTVPTDEFSGVTTNPDRSTSGQPTVAPRK